METLIIIIMILYVNSINTDNYCPQIININRGSDSSSNYHCASKLDVHDAIERLLETVTDMPVVNNSSNSNPFLPFKPRDCQDIQRIGQNTTGIYTIYPGTGNNPIRVRCDMDTASSGWTVFQRRINSSDFYKTWNEYQVGFGELDTNFWLGNQQIHMISTQGWYQLRIDLVDFDGEHRYAEYQVFSVGDIKSQYELSVDGYKGDAGDSFSMYNGMKFSTKDRDNDISGNNCAQVYHGAWWYKNCHDSNLNGDYGNTQPSLGPIWGKWMGHSNPLKSTEMKIRRW